MKKLQTEKKKSRDRVQWWIVLTVAFTILVMLMISAKDPKVVQADYGQLPVPVSFVIPDCKLI